MKILLLGEYSGFHNNLKQGLLELGHEVTLISSGDGFKQYPSDIKIEIWFKKYFFLKKIKNALFFFTRIDLASIELYYRFKKNKKLLIDFDVVQLINSIVFLGTPSIETKLLNYIFKKNTKIFMIAGGMDVPWVDYMLNKNTSFSSFTPYLENPSLKKYFLSGLKYTKFNFKKHYNFVYKNLNGIIPIDMDYEIVYNGLPKATPLIPTPINILKHPFKKLNLEQKIIIFCGINTTNQYAKGVQYFLKALNVIEEKYKNKVIIKITKNLPYNDYMEVYNEAHILLDQCLSFDQGYNGREAMAKGKVVFSGANDDFKKHYNITEENMPLIEAKPDVDYLVNKLSELIENPIKIKDISIRARKFIEQYHNHINIAQKYVDTWLDCKYEN